MNHTIKHMKMSMNPEDLEIKSKSKLQRKIEDFKYKFNRKIRHLTWPIRYCYYGIHNIIRWTPILWRDRDWDHSYIYEILAFKLKNQAEHIGKWDNHTTAAYDASRMMMCVRLIDRLKDDYYSVEYFDYKNSNYIWKNTPKSKDLMELETELISENLQAFLDKHKSAYNKLKRDTEFLKHYRPIDDMSIECKAIHLSQYNQIRAKKLLFKIMETHIEGWWD